MIKKYTVITPDPDQGPIYEGNNYRAALAAARNYLGVARLIHDHKPWPGQSHWLHASRVEGCASLEIIQRS